MEDSVEQLWNADEPIDITLCGIIIEDNLLQLLKILSFKIVIVVDWIETETKFEQLWNADAPIDVTLDGIVIEVNTEQLWNVDAPIDVTLDGIVIEVNTEQLWNVDEPIDDIPFGTWREIIATFWNA